MTAVLLVAALALFVAGRPVVATTTTTGCAGLDNVQQQIHTPVPLAVCEALEKYVVVHREAADDSPVLCHGGLHDRLRGVYFFCFGCPFRRGPSSTSSTCSGTGAPGHRSRRETSGLVLATLTRSLRFR